jgi:excisionase family DNA binding protein
VQMSTGDYVTIAEAGRLLNLAPASVRKAIQQGRITPLRLSKRIVLIARAEVERYQRERRPRGWPAGKPRQQQES